MKARKKRVPSKVRRPTVKRAGGGQGAAEKTLQSRASIGPASDRRERYIAEAAYLIAEHEGFPPGRELEHWLRAEAEFERLAAARARRRAKRGPV
jgi:hypothetical protein